MPSRRRTRGRAWCVVCFRKAHCHRQAGLPMLPLCHRQGCAERHPDGKRLAGFGSDGFMFPRAVFGGRSMGRTARAQGYVFAVAGKHYRASRPAFRPAPGDVVVRAAVPISAAFHAAITEPDGEVRPAVVSHLEHDLSARLVEKIKRYIEEQTHAMVNGAPCHAEPRGFLADLEPLEMDPVYIDHVGQDRQMRVSSLGVPAELLKSEGGVNRADAWGREYLYMRNSADSLLPLHRPATAGPPPAALEPTDEPAS